MASRRAAHSGPLESTAMNGLSRASNQDEILGEGDWSGRVIARRRNTLVVPNTSGYHCRSLGRACPPIAIAPHSKDYADNRFKIDRRHSAPRDVA